MYGMFLRGSGTKLLSFGVVKLQLPLRIGILKEVHTNSQYVILRGPQLCGCRD